MHSAVDKSDVQALVRTGFGDLTEGCYYLVVVRELAAARAWLRAAAPLVTNAVSPEEAGKPETKLDPALQLAFTYEGLQALGLPASAASGFSTEFLSGMAGGANRLRRLGDTGANAPAHWDWGGPGKVPHILVALFAAPSRLRAWNDDVKGALWPQAFREVACLDTTDLEGRIEPFGFVDGISQPAIDWDGHRGVQDDDRFSNLIAAGEFILGYPNEYGRLTERPLVDAKDDPKGLLPPASDERGQRDLGLNGSYVVFRDLAQDVRGLWQFLERQSGGDRAAREELGALMVGRRRDGAPLVPPSEEPIPGIALKETYNHFTFDSDPRGGRCPFGSHIRRTNPRNADLPRGTSGLFARLKRMLGFGGDGRDDLISPARLHRILRRGREYGPELKPDDAAKPGADDGVRRGLRFLCVNANISRQFEFVQQAWCSGTKFAGMTEQSDPLLGHRSAVPDCLSTDVFTVPVEGGVARCITGMPQFVTVRGGGYFFLPGLRALRYIASLGA